MSTAQHQSTRALAPLTVPFTVIIDTREQLPYTFATLRADARDNYRPLVVPTVGMCLGAGDYGVAIPTDAEIGNSLAACCIERKSLTDLFGTIGGGRARFQRELHRLAELDRAAVVVEAEWSTVIRCPPTHSRLRPKVIHRSVIAWQLAFPSIHWWFCPNRDFAERTTFRILERFWRERGAQNQTTKE